MRPIATTLLKVTSSLLLAVCAGFWVMTSLPAFGWQALAIPTGSMQPNVPIGSLVLTRRVPLTGLHAGDIITYKNPLNLRETITHRIIKTYRIGGKVPGFITKGDANKLPDIPIPGGNVVGRVIWHAAYLGSAVTWARSWAGVAVLVYAPALLMMVEEWQRLIAYYRQLVPYRLPGYARAAAPRARPLPAFLLAGCVAIAGLGVAWQPLTAALLASNTVTLTNNRLIRTAQPATCTATNINSVTVQNSSSQSASSGSASGPKAASAAVTNTNSMATTVVIANARC